MALDPEDPRPPYQQVANSLRAAILTRKFSPGDKLPSQQQLAEHYGVARMTIQQALRILREEGLILSRSGSGVFFIWSLANGVGALASIGAWIFAYLFFSAYLLPVLFLGVGLPDDRFHAPNERLVMDQFWKGLLAAGELWHELGAVAWPA